MNDTTHAVTPPPSTTWRRLRIAARTLLYFLLAIGFVLLACIVDVAIFALVIWLPGEWGILVLAGLISAFIGLFAYELAMRLEKLGG